MYMYMYHSLTALFKARTCLPRYQVNNVGHSRGARETFWPDALPAATKWLARVPAGVEPRFAEFKSVALTTEPWLGREGRRSFSFGGNIPALARVILTAWFSCREVRGHGITKGWLKFRIGRALLCTSD